MINPITKLVDIYVIYTIFSTKKKIIGKPKQITD